MIIPLFKSGSMTRPKNDTGISQLNVPGKIFTGVIENRLPTWIEVKELISDTQAGFHQGYSTLLHCEFYVQNTYVNAAFMVHLQTFRNPLFWLIGKKMLYMSQINDCHHKLYNVFKNMHLGV